MHKMKEGEIITAEDHRQFSIVKFLGRGGQGEVYLVKNISTGNLDAFKLYHKDSSSALSEEKIRALTNQPSPGPRFLWPETVAHTDSGYGYIMKLREERFKSINDLLLCKVNTSWYVLARVGMELADSFKKLHSYGLRYCDISPNNIFFDPDTGEILICDNDNVDIDGKPSPPVIGTPRFIAPELVRGEAKPSRLTDLFSLAVINFYLFVLHHPLDGQLESNIRCLDGPAQKQLYGKNPIFIYDPSNTSNRPVPGLHENARICWPLLPKGIQDLFIRSFTEGLHNPDRRVEEGVWRKAMAALQDLWLSCSSCQADQFADLQANELVVQACWNCGHMPKLPLRLHLQTGSQILLHSQAKICQYHLMLSGSSESSQVIGTVGSNPKNPNQVGLKNLTDDKTWIVTHENQTTYLEPGKSVGLKAGMVFTFGSVKGVVK